MSEVDCLIIGAGIAGLMAATELKKAGLSTLIVEKESRVGGRIATQTVAGAIFDSGAQFFTIRDERFARHVSKWQAAGIVLEWSRGFGKVDGYPRYRGADGMAALPRHLARSLQIRTGMPFTAITVEAGKWQATLQSGEQIGGRGLIMTPPAPVSLGLLPPTAVLLPQAVRDALNQIGYDPCLALLLRLDRPSQVPAPGAVQLMGEPVRWLADNQLKGISQEPGITVHAGNLFSKEYWEAPPEEILESLRPELDEYLGEARVTEIIMKRWLHSEPVQLYPSRTLYTAQPQPLAFAGDAFYEARVEGAALSGLAAADVMREALD